MREEASQSEEARSREKGYQEASHLHPEMVHLMPHSERNNLDAPTFMRLQQFEEETSRREREEARQKARDENRQRELALAKKIFKNRYFNGIIIFDTNVFLEEDKETVKSFFRTCISFIEPCNHLDGVSKVGRIVCKRRLKSAAGGAEWRGGRKVRHLQVKQEDVARYGTMGRNTP